MASKGVLFRACQPQKIKNAVLEAHNHGTISGWGGEMERYVSVDDKDFDIMREVREIVEKNN